MAVSCFLVIFLGKGQAILFSARGDESRDVFWGVFSLDFQGKSGGGRWSLVIPLTSF